MCERTTHLGITKKNKEKDVAYSGRRFALRLCSDWYGRGVVRGQAENINLRAHGIEHSDVTNAESIRSAAVAIFCGSSFLSCVERLSDKQKHSGATRMNPSVDTRNLKTKDMSTP